MGFFGLGKPSDKDIREFAERAGRRQLLLAKKYDVSPDIASEIVKDNERSLRDIYARLKDWEKTKKDFAKARGMTWPV